MAPTLAPRTPEPTFGPTVGWVPVDEIAIINALPTSEEVLAGTPFDVVVQYSTTLAAGEANVRVMMRYRSTKEIIWFQDIIADTVQGGVHIHHHEPWGH